jgi:hypothetical protein
MFLPSTPTFLEDPVEFVGIHVENGDDAIALSSKFPARLHSRFEDVKRSSFEPT